MNDEAIQDLKQFITATVFQATSDLATKDDLTKLKTKLVTRMDNGFAEVMSAIGDTIAVGNNLRDQQYTELTGRLTKLEPVKA